MAKKSSGKTLRRTTRKPARPAPKRTSSVRKSAPNLDALIRKYIDVILDVGLNLRPGQRLFIAHSLQFGVDVEFAPIVRLVAEGAYRRGASFVDVVWGDPRLERLRMQKAPRDSFGYYPTWPSSARNQQSEAGAAFLSLRGDDPDLHAGIDPKDVNQYLSSIRDKIAPAFERLSRNAVNWCVATVSSPQWAASVLPKVPAAKRVERLWQLIFETCRIGDGDAVARWRKQLDDLARRQAYLNAKQYSWMSYTGPGTKLKVGLPPNHVWHGGQITAENGVVFVPNLPTEEVFTLADRGRVEGEVTATKPLVYASTSIDGMHLTFSEGKVVNFTARKGEGLLGELLRSDEGASRLGEVALVPHSSPISRMGVTFHNTLFDENASCHLAFGNGYRFTLKGGEPMTTEQFAQAGGNSSKVHSDFMIGSAKIDIDGIRADGTSEPVMRKGEWAFEV